MRVKLIEIAEVIRSKNSGPYELTLDIIFRAPDIFLKVLNQNIITHKLIAGLYRVKIEDVLAIIVFEPAKAIKINLKRPLASGDLGETDVYGAQQHAPLLDLELDLDLEGIG